MFIWALNEYFDKKVNLLFNQCSKENMSYLESFFDCFDDVYDYCAVIYKIDRKLVRDMITSGANAINSGKRVVKYMDLAEQFWRKKINILCIGWKHNKAILGEIDDG